MAAVRMSEQEAVERGLIAGAREVVKKRKKPGRDEENLQKQCVEWFDKQHPRLRQRLFHVPNALAFAGGGNRGAFMGKMARLKAMGLRSGIPDLFLAIPSKGFHGLFLEAKSEMGTVSKEQGTFMASSAANGYATQVFRTLDEFVTTVGWYLEM